MFRIFISLSFLLFAVSTVFAQITITENRFTDRIGTTYRTVLYETNIGIGGQLQDLILADGENQVWDFADLNYVDSTASLQLLELADDNDPYLQDERLAGSTHRMTIASLPVSGGMADTAFQLQYITFLNGEYRFRGAISIFDENNDGMRDTFFNFYNPDFLQVKFPVTYGATFQDSTGRTAFFDGFPLPAITELDSNFVEGWGELITPGGTVEALRVREKSISIIPGLPTQEVTRSLNFVTQDGANEAIINLNDEWAFYQKSTIAGGGPSAVPSPALPDFGQLSVFPNPASSESQVRFELSSPRELTISLHDFNGKQLKLIKKAHFGSGAHQLPLFESPIAAGSYFVRISSNNTAVQQLVIVTR